MAIYISETFINKDKDAIYGESGVYETWTNDRGKLYKSLVQEYGRCVSKVYRDTTEGTKAIGWVFEKRTKYDDSNDTYLREVWVTLHERKPETTVKHFPMYID